MTGAAGDAAALTGRYAGGELKVSRAILAAADGLARKGSRAATVTLASAGPSERVHMRMAVSGDARPEAVLAAAQPAPAAAAAPAAQVTTIAPTVSAIATSAAPPA
jgi:hypothetical protein